MKLNSVIRNLDIIGKEVQFKIDDSETYKTLVGGILTIILTIVCLITIWFFGNDIIYRANPSFIQKELTFNESDFIQLNNSNFIFAIRFTDFYGRFVSDPRVLVPQFRYEYYEMNLTTKELVKIFNVTNELGYCNYSHVNSNLLENYQLDTYYCADLKNYTIGGSWSGDRLGIMYFFAIKCNKNIENEKNITCIDENEIKEKYNGLLYQDTLWWNNILDPTSYINPVRLNLDYKYQVLDPAFRKENKYFYSVNELHTDDGILFPEEKNETYLVVDYMTLDVGTERENILCDTNINFTKKKKRNSRSYLKIQDVAATVGGFLSIVLYAFRFLYYFYVEIHMQYRYYNELLKFQVDKDPSNIVEEESKITVINFKQTENNNVITLGNKESRLKDIVITHQLPGFKKKESENNYMAEGTKTIPNVDTILSGTCRKGSRLRKIINTMKKKRSSLDITYYDLFIYTYCLWFKKRKETNANIKYQLIFQAEYEINKKVDSIRILQLFDQFKLVKKIILNENQCFMLDNLGKKMIKNHKITSENDFSKILEGKRKEKIESLQEYWKSRKILEEINDIDLVLLSVMDDDLRSKLETGSFIETT